MMLRKMTFLFALLAALLFWYAPNANAMSLEEAKNAQNIAMKKIPAAAQKLYEPVFSTAEAKSFVQSNCLTGFGSFLWKLDIFGLADGIARDQYRDYLIRLDDCKPENFIEIYKGTDEQPKCFSCRPVAFVISAFLNGCARSYPIMRTAGKTILTILTALWIAYHFLLSKIISFNEIDPMEYLQELFVFLFKVFIAYVCLSGGLSVLMQYTMNPIIDFGTSMALGFLTSLT